jgi:hypothetical protein
VFSLIERFRGTLQTTTPMPRESSNRICPEVVLMEVSVVTNTLQESIHRHPFRYRENEDAVSDAPWEIGIISPGHSRVVL